MGQLPRSADAHRLKVSRHSPANPPYIGRIAFLQHPVALGLVSKIDDAACVALPFLRRMVCELGQGLGRRDADTNRNAGTTIHLRSDLPAKQLEISRHAGKIGKGFVDAVDLRCRHHGLDDGHDALGHPPWGCQ